MSQLTSSQQAAADAFFEFLMKEDKTFVISGGAGTGKTFTMAHLKNNVLKEYQANCKMLGIAEEYNDVIFTATTNKAAEVLEKATGENTKTIHSLLGLKVTEDYKTGKTFIQPTNRTQPIQGKILFIDESSMIDTELYKFIEELCSTSKVIFVGDHAQMAPVNEEISPIYLNVDPHNFVFLDKPVRNAGQPALVDLCAQLRDTVENGIFHPIEPVPGVIEYLEPQEMSNKVTEYFTEFNDSAKILCYTNSRVMAYNDHIRDMRGKPHHFEKEDILIVASAFVQGTKMLGVEREVEVIEITDEPRDGGYKGYAKEFDGPLMYREATVTARSGNMVTVRGRVAENPEHLRAVLKSLSRKKDWQQYFAVKNSYMDLRDRDACTVYKSQGSTYETVFIDIGNIGTSRDAAQVARMLFVGASRATTKVYLYGQLPGRYIGRKVA